VETLKLDNQVAVPLVRLEPPTAAAAVAAGHVLRRKAASRMSPHLSQRGASARLPAPQLRRSQRRKRRSRRRVLTPAAVPPLPDCYVYQNDAAYADRCGGESTRLDLDTRVLERLAPTAKVHEDTGMSITAAGAHPVAVNTLKKC
jgi:hypothetical protein